MDDIEIERVETKIEKEIEDAFIKKVDDIINKKIGDIEDRINEIDITVQNFLQREEPDEEPPQDKINKEIFERLEEIENKVKKMRKVLENMTFSAPTVID